MNRRRIRYLYALALILLGLTLSPPPAVAAGVATLHINIMDVDPANGAIIVILLYDRDYWLEPGKAVRRFEIQAKGKDSYFVDLLAVPYPETYGIQVFQDENGNGKLDMRWLPYPHPTEPYGFSNNYKPLAKPSFNRAAFPVNKSEVTLQIDMRN